MDKHAFKILRMICVFLLIFSVLAGRALAAGQEDAESIVCF